MKNRKIDVLGSEWYILFRSEKDDEYLKTGVDGYTDYTTKTIVVAEIEKGIGVVENIQEHMKKVARHEVVHAFLCESGLRENSSSITDGWATNEEMVDWIAFQGPKICKAWADAELI